MSGYRPVKRTTGWGSARVQRQFQLLSILYEERYANDATHDPDGGWLTTGQLAREMQMTPSPHFRELVDEMFGKQYLEVRVNQWRKNMPVYLWRIQPHVRFTETWKASFDAWLEPERTLA